MKLAHEKGAPVMRPLFFDFPKDATSWTVEDQYMFGPDVLVAPIMEAQQRSRTTYLPAGTRWQNVWTGQWADGGTHIEVEAPLRKSPYLFGRCFHPRFYHYRLALFFTITHEFLNEKSGSLYNEPLFL